MAGGREGSTHPPKSAGWTSLGAGRARWRAAAWRAAAGRAALGSVAWKRSTTGGTFEVAVATDGAGRAGRDRAAAAWVAAGTAAAGVTTGAAAVLGGTEIGRAHV